MRKLIFGILAILLTLLFIGSVCAFDVDNMKSPVGYTEIKGGCAQLMNDKSTELYIGKMSLNEGVFENDTGYIVYPFEDNFYIFEDSTMNQHGVQEKVNINGEDYLVSISKDSGLSAADKTLFKDDLKSFNIKNNLKPLEV